MSVKCPFCGTQFLEEEGLLCDCRLDYEDMQRKWDMARDAYSGEIGEE